jgi:CarD family transcriptional regulator
MTEPAATLALSVGDRVVYPNQGLCVVTDIKKEEIAGQQLVFVSLQFLETGAKVKVPKDKLVKNGVRLLSDGDDVKKVVDFLKSDSEKASLDWKARARTNTLRLSEGGLVGVAEVVKGLQVLSELRPLPPKEREQYNDARHLFVSELAAALKIAEVDAEDTLDVVLFPVGKDRPKRTAEEFAALGGDDLGLGDDLLGLDGDTEAAEPEEAVEGEKPEGEEGEEGAEAAAPAPKKKGKAGAAVAPPPKKSLISDIEVTAPAASALDEAPVKKKRGRPPKPKPLVIEPLPVPKKRGRPPKVKDPAAVVAAPKKRGRPPKAKK